MKSLRAIRDIDKIVITVYVSKFVMPCRAVRRQGFFIR